MKQSKSPVYGVVKKHAHSAAAIITTGAEKYFICRGAEMLHHQPHVLEVSIKNVKKHEEKLKFIKSRTKKALGPKLKNFKCTYEQFVDKMYKNSCDG